MSLALQSEQLVTLRNATRVLVQEAGAHAAALRALVAAAELQIRYAEEAVARALDLDVGGLQRLHAVLSAQVQRSQDGAKTARQLFTCADAQWVAAGVLLAHVDGAVTSEEREGGDGSPVAVLVVDDHGDIREVVADVLRIAGFNVRTAANGLEGLLAACEMHPTVIVMDFTMPVLDGIQATRLIKANAATRQARVIAYTGNPVPADTVAQKLFAAVLQKPATPAAILAAVERVANY